MRTRAEVVMFFEDRVGTRVDTVPSSDLNGQCVTLEKALLAFLGAPNPWKARGNAKDYGDAIIREGIGVPGKGWLTMVVNRTMGVVRGVTYGHIWDQIADGANYEQNGARALRVTKNTRPLSQGQQFINLDQWITPEGGNPMAANENFVNNCATAVGRGIKPGTQLPYNTKTGVWNDPAAKAWVGKPEDVVLQGWLSSPEGQDWFAQAANFYKPVPPTDMEEVGNNTGLFQKKRG